MLEKILFLEYSDLGSGKSNSSYRIATDNLMLRFTQMAGKRGPQNNSSKYLEMTYFSVPKSHEDLHIKDFVYLKGDSKIWIAERRLVDKKGKLMDSDNLNTGIFAYETPTKEEWEKSGREGGIADEKTCAALTEQTEMILSEFRARFGRTLERRAVSVGGLYPINPEKFFKGDYSAGLGPIFRERFWINGRYACPNAQPPGAAFHISAETARYTLRFDYDKHFPMKGNWTWRAGSLCINRGNLGFKVLFDENFDVRVIKETGAPSTWSDKMYVEEDFKSGTGKALHENVMGIWEEAREELNIDKRIESCEELTAEDLDRAKEVVPYASGRGKFPTFSANTE